MCTLGGEQRREIPDFFEILFLAPPSLPSCPVPIQLDPWNHEEASPPDQNRSYYLCQKSLQSMLFDYHFVLQSNTCAIEQPDFPNNETTKRGQWLTWGSFADPVRPLQKRKWWGRNPNMLSSLVTVLGEAAVPLISCYSELLFGNQNGLYKLFIPLVMGRRMVMCSPQKCKGKKTVKKKKKKKLLLMIQTEDNWLLSQCNTKKENKQWSEAQWETDLFTRKVIWQRRALIQQHKGWYLPELPRGERCEGSF